MTFKAASKIASPFTSTAISASVPVPAGQADKDIALVYLFTEKDLTAQITPPTGFTLALETSWVASRGMMHVFWKRCSASEGSSWEFDFPPSLPSAGVGWAGLWSGRIQSGSPLNISTQQVVDRVTQIATTGTAADGDDAAFGFTDWNGVAETVAGMTLAIEDLTGLHLFYDDSATAGSVSVIPSPASSSNTYWYTLISLTAAGLTADAGPDQSVDASTTVTLAGAGSGGTTPYTYAWTQTAGTSVTLSSATAQNPTFTAPATAGGLTFSLVVTDAASTVSAPDTINVSVSARPVGTPAAPVNTTIKGWASAPTVTVPLAAASTAGNSLIAILTVRNANAFTTPIVDDARNVWQLATSTRAVTGLGQPIRQFIYYTSRAAPVTTLTATFLDSSLIAAPGSGTIHILEFAGDMGTPTGVNSGGNIASDPTPYGVTIGSGASAIVIGALGLGVNNRVWAIAAGWTSDGHDGTQPDVDQYAGYKIVTGPTTTGPSWTRTAGTQTDSTQVTIEFPGGVAVPQANAGTNQSVNTGAGVTLHGTATAGTAPYTYQWTQTLGPSVVLSSNTDQNPTFTASTAGTYWFQLVATDDDGISSAPATAIVVASDPGTGTVLVRKSGSWIPAVVKVHTGGSWV